MDRWWSYAVATIVLAVLATHLAATLVYLSPPNIAKEHLGRVAAAYMQPLFAQNWHLFSPHPGISTRKLAVRCHDEEQEWSDWFDPTEGLIARHNASRISGIGKLLYVYRGIGEDLRRRVQREVVACQRRRATIARPEIEQSEEDQLTALEHVPLDELAPDAIDCSPAALMDAVVPTPEFALATRYAESVCERWASERMTTLSATQIELLEFFPVKYADRPQALETGRRWDRVYEVVFPVLAAG